MDYHFLLNLYLKRRKADGFTLIELLVVVIIIGVLAAIAAPELLKQVEKGRQAEAVSTLGSINRAQQGYRYENPTFAPLASLPVKIPPGKYYDIDDDTASYNTPDAFGSAQRARAKGDYTNDIRNYASAVGQTSTGVFKAIICPATSPTDDTVGTDNNNGDVICDDPAPPVLPGGGSP
jgi:prepilin-type N-terminal cleavage/methylation domain-containing protein